MDIRNSIIKFQQILIDGVYEDYNRTCSREDYEKAKLIQIEWLKQYKNKNL